MSEACTEEEVSALRPIVARCHVADSNRKVLKYAVTRLRKGWRTFRGWDRAKRRRFGLAVIRAHAAHQELYCFVTRRFRNV